PPAAPEGSRAAEAPPAEPARGSGYVTAAANPFALVRNNGKEVGTTPILRHRLPAGRHEIVLASPDSGAVPAPQHRSGRGRDRDHHRRLTTPRDTRAPA